jgi:hypothetical protein
VSKQRNSRSLGTKVTRQSQFEVNNDILILMKLEEDINIKRFNRLQQLATTRKEKRATQIALFSSTCSFVGHSSTSSK